MFEQNGLSLDQAPPLSVILGLFMIGGLFGILGGVSIVYYNSSIWDASSAGSIITIHILALGVMMSFMIGALFQMLPVIAGVVLDNPIPKANLVKILLILGILSLLSGFATKIDFLFLFASIFLGSSLLYTSAVMSIRLVRVKNHSASSRGMMFALLNMAILVLMALYMTTVYAQMHDGIFFPQIKQIHYSFALFGWISLLIASISFQTVEMFYVTPKYPVWMSRYMAPALLALLLLLSLTISVDSKLSTPIRTLIYLQFIIYGIYTMIRLSQRKRPLADATVWFWRIGMGSLLGSMLLLITRQVVNIPMLTTAAAVLFAAFASSVMFAMFYKIVPFLTWFHLNAQGYLSAPMMHEVIHPKTAKKHMWIHASSIIAFLISLVMPIAIYFAGLTMVVSFASIVYQIIHAGNIYRYTLKNSEKFDFSAS